MQYLLLFLGNSGYANAAQCLLYVHCPSSNMDILVQVAVQGGASGGNPYPRDEQMFVSLLIH